MTDKLKKEKSEGELDQANKNPVSQVYTWIKTQDDLAGIDFTSASDV